MLFRSPRAMRGGYCVQTSQAEPQPYLETATLVWKPGLIFLALSSPDVGYRRLACRWRARALPHIAYARSGLIHRQMLVVIRPDEALQPLLVNQCGLTKAHSICLGSALFGPACIGRPSDVTLSNRKDMGSWRQSIEIALGTRLGSRHETT